MKSIKKSLTIVVLALYLPINCLNIVFDLGGVIFDTDGFSAFCEIGPGTFLANICSFNNPLAARDKLYEILHQVPALSDNEFEATDDHGVVMPAILCDWQRGLQTCAEIKRTILHFIKKNKNLFANKAERRTIKAIVTMMFTPERLAKTRKMHNDAYEFVKQCKQNGHNCYILSNWDSASFKAMSTRFPELFALMDGIMISGKEGIMKPNPVVYEHFLDTFDLDGAETVFIDDQQINIDTAQEYMHGIVCTKKQSLWKKVPDFDTVAQRVAAIAEQQVAA